MLLTTLLTSCTDEDIVKEGIDVLPDERTEYSDSTTELAKKVFYNLLRLHYIKDNGRAPTDEAEAAIVGKSEEIRLSTLDAERITESDYLEFVGGVARNTEHLVDLLLSLSESDLTRDELRRIYLDLSKSIDGIYTGRLFYHLSLYIYDYKYDKQMALYSELGYPYLKIKADELRSEREIFVTKIGEANCAGAMQLFLIASDLFFGGAFDDGVLSGFSDDEALLVLQYADFSELSMQSDGWELLLSYYFKAASFKDVGYYPSLLKHAVASGEGQAIGSVMNDVVLLICAAKQNITADDISALRRGESDKVIAGIFSRFDDEDWQTLERIGCADVTPSIYSAYAQEKYGEDYLIYSMSVGTATLAELKGAVGSDSFLPTLEKYLAGISPALAYGVNK